MRPPHAAKIEVKKLNKGFNRCVCMAFAVFHAEIFDKKLDKFSVDFKNWVDKIEDQLTENPYAGDPIKVKWFREKKLGKYRLYYLIYEEEKAIYMVGISEKKDQQKVISTLWFLLDEFKADIQNLTKK